jgi:hypothetical protein
MRLPDPRSARFLAAALLTLGPGLAAYVALQLAAVAGAALALARRPAAFSILSRRYLRFLAAPWRLATFLAAAGAFVVVAPWTGDPTWDRRDAGFMSVLTFLTAPWAVGTLFLSLRRRASLAHALVAAVAWLLSASWSYDLYILWRDGLYPLAWRENLAASSVLYASGGLMWNLEWRRARGVHFAFQEPGWPEASEGGGLGRIALYALPFVVFGIAAVAVFFW